MYSTRNKLNDRGGGPRIVSPMATGNGAYVVHTWLEKRIRGYRVVPYHPYWTLAPFLLPLLRAPGADLIHTTPDYATLLRSPGRPLVVSFQNYVLDQQWTAKSYAVDLYPPPGMFQYKGNPV